MAKQMLTYEDVKQMFPEYPYVLATLNDIPVLLCKTQEDALKSRDEKLSNSAIIMKVVDVRLL